MSVSLFSALPILVTLVFVWLGLRWRLRRTCGLPLPPGPKGLPIIGNVLDMPAQEEWEAVRQWGETYGDLVYVCNFGFGVLFINSYETAVEILEKRGSNYSSRPVTTLSALEGWPEYLMTFMPYGDGLRKSRQYLNRFFQKSALPEYYEVQTQSVQTLLIRLLQDPLNFREHIRQTTNRAIIKIVYGYEIVENDPEVDTIDRALQAAAESVGFFLVNALPALRHLPSWFPGARFHDIAKEGRRKCMTMIHDPYQKAKYKMTDGTASPSMLSKLLDMYPDPQNEINIARAAVIAYAGGGDTAISALLTFVLAMVLYPEAMRKGQEELDRVIGRNRLPSFEDRPNLPYIEAIWMECLRWQPVLPLGIPHVAEKDDIFNGYFIPAGTAIFFVAWANSRDPKKYMYPEEFLPERWLVKPGTERPLDPRQTSFGFGRRICPGRFFAENALFIAVASILAVFDIRKATNAFGAPITPQAKYFPSPLRHPLPFECKITPRFDAAVALIRQGSSPAK